MILKVENKEYNIEFSFEAALYKECADTALGFFSNTTGKVVEGESDESKFKRIKDYLSKITNMPTVAITFLYAGLLEYHGTGEDADGSIKNKSDALRLYKKFCKENPEDEKADFYGLYAALMEQMGEDGFFKLLGIDKMMSNAEKAMEEQKNSKKKK